MSALRKTAGNYTENPLQQIFEEARARKGSAYPVEIASDVDGTLLEGSSRINTNLMKFLVVMRLAGANVTIFSQNFSSDQATQFRLMAHSTPMSHLFNEMGLNSQKKAAVLREIWMPQDKAEFTPDVFAGKFDVLFEDSDPRYANHDLHIHPVHDDKVLAEFVNSMTPEMIAALD